MPATKTPSMHSPWRWNVTTSDWVKITATHAKISPKMVNSRDKAGNTEDEEEQTYIPQTHRTTIWSETDWLLCLTRYSPRVLPKKDIHFWNCTSISCTAAQSWSVTLLRKKKKEEEYNYQPVYSLENRRGDQPHMADVYYSEKKKGGRV